MTRASGARALGIVAGLHVAAEHLAALADHCADHPSRQALLVASKQLADRAEALLAEGDASAGSARAVRCSDEGG